MNKIRKIDESKAVPAFTTRDLGVFPVPGGDLLSVSAGIDAMDALDEAGVLMDCSAAVLTALASGEHKDVEGLAMAALRLDQVAHALLSAARWGSMSDVG